MGTWCGGFLAIALSVLGVGQKETKCFAKPPLTTTPTRRGAPTRHSPRRLWHGRAEDNVCIWHLHCLTAARTEGGIRGVHRSRVVHESGAEKCSSAWRQTCRRTLPATVEHWWAYFWHRDRKKLRVINFPARGMRWSLCARGETQDISVSMPFPLRGMLC